MRISLDLLSADEMNELMQDYVAGTPLGVMYRELSQMITPAESPGDFLPCDGCTACCTAMEIYETKKPSGVKCPNDCGGGCDIYDTKPESCTAFHCLWRARVIGNGEARFRPDRCGVVGNVIPGTAFAPMIVSFHEARPGAFDEPDARELVAQVSSKIGVLAFVGTCSGDERRYLGGPRDQVAAMEKRASEVGRKAGFGITFTESNYNPSVPPAVQEQGNDALTTA